MIKVLWFLKRADHLTLEEFKDWWINHHAADIAADQAPFLRGYKIDIRVADDSSFLGKPAGDCPWDGLAEQYFDSMDDYNAVYSRDDRPTRTDTMEHCSRFERLVVEEFDMPVVRQLA